ncbi:hypothetical protein PG989_004513 [Apiospora arundinis]
MPQLDALFYSERYQRTLRSGVMSWRVPALTGPLQSMSAPIDFTSDPDVIQVDEWSWLSFLKKDRWFDLRSDAFAGISNPEMHMLNHDTNWWTVDNPAMWKYIRIALELANRVFNSIIEARHPWLDTLLFSDVQYWSDVNQELANWCAQNGAQSPPIMFERPIEQRATSAQMRQRLEDVLRFNVLTFTDETSYNWNEPCLGYSALVFGQDVIDLINKLAEGDLDALIPTMRSTRNPKILPRFVKKPSGNVQTKLASQDGIASKNAGSAPDPSQYVSLEELVGQAAWESQATNPDGSVMNANEFAASLSGDISADEFIMNPVDCSMSCFHVAPLRCLLNTKSRPHEKWNAIMAMSAVIMHELAHNLIMGRRRLDGDKWNHIIGEPIIYPLLGREVGNAFETTFFGGVVEADMVTEDSVGYSNGANTHISLAEWPGFWLESGSIPDSWLPPGTTDITRHSLPAAYPLSMISEKYWRAVVPHWGLGAIKAPKVLTAIGSSTYLHYAPRWHSARLTNTMNVAPEVRPKYESFRQAWNKLTAWNNSVRPWWEEQYLKWSLSPWSQIGARKWILEFREAHARRDLMQCTKLVWNMINYMGKDKFEAGFDPVVGPSMNLWYCIASLMMASIPVLQGEMGYKGPPMNVLAHPSISATLRWTEPLTVHPITLESFRMKQEHSPGPWKHPKEGLSAFWDRFCPMGMCYDIPHVWLEACYNTFQKLWVHHQTTKSNQHWAEFDFDIPPYDDNWAFISEHSINVNYYNMPVYQWVRSSAPTGNERDFYQPSPPMTPVSRRTNQQQQQQQDQSAQQKQRTPPWRQRPRPRQLDHRSRSRSRGKRDLYPVHFSTGEVGNNMDDDDFWVIECDGNGGYDIFSISGLCLQMGYPTADMIRRELITLNTLGPKLREDGHPGADQIRGELTKSCPNIGKLLLPRTAEQISEYDGEGGMPLWIILGTTVYDITRFSFGTQREQAQLTQNPGSRPTSLPDDPDAYDDLLKRLQPFRCALFEGQKAPKKMTLPLFTPNMLKWHDNPTAGMYIAIDGIVYNVSTYVDLHPGGRDLMGQALGQDVSNFHQYHAPDTMADYGELAVGRLVPDVELGELGPHQLVIHDWVFDLTKLSSGAEDEWARRVLAPLAGTDASDAIRGLGTDAAASALVHVFDRRKEAIVGRVAPALGEIPVGEVGKHDDPRSFHGAWVTIDGYVFDVTTLMLHGKAIHGKELPHLWAGKEVQDTALRAWLWDEFQYRIIGRAVAGEASPEPTVEELVRRHTGVDRAEVKAEEERLSTIWGFDKNDPTCGGLVQFCHGARGGRHEHEHSRAAAGPGNRGMKRAAGSGDGDDTRGPAMKKRG